ncbi:MrpH family fimbial adhesin [Serratia ficaria]|nr:hypothetical protein [Serratia ficaria]
MQAVIGWNPTHIMASNLLVDKNPPSSCHTADCNVSLTGARTLGELVPLMKYRGAFGKPSTQFAAYSQRYRTCILVTWVQAQTTSQYYVDCSPVKETNAGCDINDDNAIIDFGTFSNDVKTRQANGSFRVHCANDSNIRVKFLSNSTKISLSDDGKLNAGLKIRNSTPGSTELESFIKLPAGEQKIFIDAELSNDKTSHVGPFSASVVAIVEVA